jgi:hypothetical protein
MSMSLPNYHPVTHSSRSCWIVGDGAELDAVDRGAPAEIQERDNLHKRKMAEEAGAAPAVPDEGNTCLANKRDDLASRLSSMKRRW